MNSKFFLVLIAFVLAFFVWNFVDDGIAYSKDSSSLNREYWSQQIENNGSDDAYQEFLKKNHEVSFDIQHVSVHVVGELFYQREGISGIQYCDSSFGFGCYHGFFGQAVSAEGATAIADLDETCVSIYGPLGTGCQHGIGHGVMEYVGGDRVNEALELCKETTQLTTLLGCTSGVFMEYNSPLASGEVTLSPQLRPFDQENPYRPCTFVDDEFKESCYFELGQWYTIVFRDDTEKAKNLCSSIDRDVYKTRCFMGLGSSFVQSLEYDVRAVVNSCAALGVIGELPCRAGASWSLYSNPAFRSESEVPCAVSSEKQKSECLMLADLTEGLEKR